MARHTPHGSGPSTTTETAASPMTAPTRLRRRAKTATATATATSWLLAVLAAFVLVLAGPTSMARGQDILQSANAIAHNHDFNCGCMEYWTCITR